MERVDDFHAHTFTAVYAQGHSVHSPLSLTQVLKAPPERESPAFTDYSRSPNLIPFLWKKNTYIYTYQIR